MKELMATNNLVTISFVETILEEADIGYLILDKNMSILEGSLGIIPRRIMVEDSMIAVACGLLIDADLEKELTTQRT